MNKQDLINSLGQLPADFLNRSQAEAAVDHVFGKIHEVLDRGEDVKISGFGTFRRVTTKARTARNPRTGETVEVPARNKVKFKASSRLVV